MHHVRFSTTSLCVLLMAFATSAAAQYSGTARISEESRALTTYPFSDENPIPILVKDPRLYPYHSFDGYSATSVTQSWNVVKLENDYIEVFVLPEVGGKVWGAIEKSTGEEFIYRNEVMKFRNISLRGPWTSGGIEFNFGIIGHTPSTATPVDYILLENDDGSVSCVVGAMDLPSRTHWRVEVRLPRDKAYFETNVLWYNPTPIQQPYYNWMTAAAFAKEDLVMSIPGNQFLRHSGEARAWPVDDKLRDLAVYRNNTFGGHKSFHVVGEYNDFFGGYYTEDDYGFGHWAPYSDMPGQKLWLWALSRQGGIWEDLLTDTDGQYIEFQAGRLFVQYAPGSHVNPITQVGFEPYSGDRWREVWFPLKGIGGLSDASRSGAMNVEARGDSLRIGINAFEKVRAALEVRQSHRPATVETLDLEPMEVYLRTVAIDAGKDYEVLVPELDLDYRSDPQPLHLGRPFDIDPKAVSSMSDVERMFFEARELMKGRRYASALSLLENVLTSRPWHREALLAQAELHYRSGQHRVGIEAARRLLQLDTYDAAANYVAGILFRAAGELVNARDALGWAARSMQYRSAANTQLAEIALQVGDYDEARRLALTSLDYDRYSVNALQVLAIAARKSGNRAAADGALSRLLEIDPIHHFAYVEQFLFDGADASKSTLRELTRSEFPEQTYLELAISYLNRNQSEAAQQVLLLGSERTANPLIEIWLAYLLRDSDKGRSDAHLATALQSAGAATPYRRETIPVLEWLVERDDAWQWKYLLALNYWAKDRTAEAADLLADIGDAADRAAVYVARAVLLDRVLSADPEPDLRKALEQADADWRSRLALAQHLGDTGRWNQAAQVLRDAVSRWSANFGLQIAYARALIHTGSADEAVTVLGNAHVLPSELAADGRTLYSWANTLVGLDAVSEEGCASAIPLFEEARTWPEHLGQGRPYEAEERLQTFLLAHCHDLMGDSDQARADYEAVAEYTTENVGDGSPLAYLGYVALQRLQRGTEAAELLASLQSKQTGESPVARWIVARAKENVDEAEALEQSGADEFEELDFELLRQALTVAGL